MLQVFRDFLSISKTISTNNSENNCNDDDILLEIYNKQELTTDWLNFIIEKCSKYLEISSALVKQLIRDKNAILLDIIFFHLKYLYYILIKYLLY